MHDINRSPCSTAWTSVVCFAVIQQNNGARSIPGYFFETFLFCPTSVLPRKAVAIEVGTSQIWPSSHQLSMIVETL
jgi:hypothetical protein